MAKCVVVYFIAQHLFVLAHSMISTMSSSKGKRYLKICRIQMNCTISSHFPYLHKQDNYTQFLVHDDIFGVNKFKP